VPARQSRRQLVTGQRSGHGRLPDRRLDIDATHAALKSRGLDVDAEVARMGDPVPPMFWLRDPTGHTLMVVQQITSPSRHVRRCGPHGR
jgi:hypothetical protein